MDIKPIKPIKTEDYIIYYEADAATVFLQGFLRLNGMEAYQPIMNLLLTVLDQVDQFTIDLHELEFLNSSGISMLSMFVVKARDRGNKSISFKGSQNILWQTRSLKNLKRLMPSLEIELMADE
ncbi:MAG: hypothetical protein WBA57_11765 [Elainellaceae cyanobacterium]